MQNSEETKDTIVFYKSFYDCIKELPSENQIEVYNAIFKKYFYDEDIELDGLSKGIFSIIIPNINSANKRYWANVKNGKKGGRPKTEEKPKQNPNNNPDKTQIEPKQNLKDKEKDKDKVNDNVNDNNIYIVEDNNVSDTAKQIIDYLNLRTGQRYKYNNKNTQEHIKQRLKEGFTLDDFKLVIDKMCIEWMNTDMQKYLRPETLFRPSKFESYLNREVKQTTKNIVLDENDIIDLFN